MKLDRIKRNFQQPLSKQYAYPNVVVNLTTEPPLISLKRKYVFSQMYTVYFVLNFTYK